MSFKTIPLFLCAVLLTGCAAESAGARVDEGAVIIDSAELRLDVPQGWSVSTGKDAYEEIYPQYSAGFDSAEEMKKALDETGEEYIAYAVSADSSAILLVTLQKMSEDSPALEKLARTLHDSTLFDYLASDYRTGSNSVFELTELAEREGWLSFFEIYLPQEGDPLFVLAQELFMFEREEGVYSVQLVYSDPDCGLRLENMLNPYVPAT